MTAPNEKGETDDQRNERIFLQEGIKNRYEKRHIVTFEDGFDEILYNTYQRNYKDLIKSFEREKKINPHILVPAPKCLVDFFYYNKMPEKEMIKSFHRYVHGYPRTAYVKASQKWNFEKRNPENFPFQEMIDFMQELVKNGKNEFLIESNPKLSQLAIADKPNNLLVHYPRMNEMVTQIILAEGEVSNLLCQIWLVVRPVGSYIYYVQHKARIKDDGSWKCQIHIGNVKKESIGLTFEVRAFINPTLPLEVEDELEEWPEAEYKSEIIIVVRSF